MKSYFPVMWVEIINTFFDLIATTLLENYAVVSTLEISDNAKNFHAALWFLDSIQIVFKMNFFFQICNMSKFYKKAWSPSHYAKSYRQCWCTLQYWSPSIVFLYNLFHETSVSERQETYFQQKSNVIYIHNCALE